MGEVVYSGRCNEVTQPLRLSCITSHTKGVSEAPRDVLFVVHLMHGGSWGIVKDFWYCQPTIPIHKSGNVFCLLYMYVFSVWSVCCLVCLGHLSSLPSSNMDSVIHAYVHVHIYK